MVLYSIGRQSNFYATRGVGHFEDKNDRFKGGEVVLYYYKVLHIIFCCMYDFTSTLSILRLAFLHV